MHYNTTSEQGDLLKEYQAQTKAQEAKILVLFRQNPNRTFTAPEVWECAAWVGQPPLTSVRRALSDLQQLGFIRKGSKRKGIFGRSNYEWKLCG
jgi:Fe2+ or Zn2+ uptake regulation protein